MKTIYLDTNAFLLHAQGIDIFDEIDRLVHETFQLVTLSTIKDELKSIMEKQRGKDKAAAKLGLQLAERVITIPSEGYVDNALVELADEHTYVLTNDKELAKRIKEKKGKIIIPKKNHLFLQDMY